MYKNFFLISNKNKNQKNKTETEKKIEYMHTKLDNLGHDQSGYPPNLLAFLEIGWSAKREKNLDGCPLQDMTSPCMQFFLFLVCFLLVYYVSWLRKQNMKFSIFSEYSILCFLGCRHSMENNCKHKICMTSHRV